MGLLHASAAHGRCLFQVSAKTKNGTNENLMLAPLVGVLFILGQHTDFVGFPTNIKILLVLNQWSS
jgi:hypothetical protein